MIINPFREPYGYTPPQAPPEWLASLAEGKCPICLRPLDVNNVCGSGFKWDIKTGREIGAGYFFEGPASSVMSQRLARKPVEELIPTVEEDTSFYNK